MICVVFQEARGSQAEASDIANSLRRKTHISSRPYFSMHDGIPSSPSAFCTRTFATTSRRPFSRDRSSRKTFKVDGHGGVKIFSVDRFKPAHVYEATLSDNLRLDSGPTKPTSGILKSSLGPTLDTSETSFSRPSQQHASSAPSTDETTVSRPDQQTMPPLISDEIAGSRNTNETTVNQPEFSQEKRSCIAPRFNIPNYNQITCDASDQSNKICETKQNEVQWPSKIQEQAGICIKYPGESETRSSFTKPSHCVSEVLTNHGQLRICKPGYQINPHSEIKLDGYGPIKQYELNKIGQSEYAQTYTWPDGKKINTSPWNRSREANHLYGVK
ncbi:unnamed protein product [Schistosoma margrebowiei]|uniref:Uncharacterized protein n=1 Tax=Schistosoma margrebowiei TaxID=48269 RepID=A0A183LQS7_9TREM|nr:unnamed protein product [Schistosoma margrebowiei]